MKINLLLNFQTVGVKTIKFSNFQLQNNLQVFVQNTLNLTAICKIRTCTQYDACAIHVCLVNLINCNFYFLCLLRTVKKIINHLQYILYLHMRPFGLQWWIISHCNDFGTRAMRRCVWILYEVSVTGQDSFIHLGAEWLGCTIATPCG